MIMSILGGGVLLLALWAAYILGREAGRQLIQDQDDPIDPADCIVPTPGGAQEESEVPNAQESDL